MVGRSDYTAVVARGQLTGDQPCTCNMHPSKSIAAGSAIATVHSDAAVAVIAKQKSGPQSACSIPCCSKGADQDCFQAHMTHGDERAYVCSVTASVQNSQNAALQQLLPHPNSKALVYKTDNTRSGTNCLLDDNLRSAGRAGAGGGGRSALNAAAASGKFPISPCFLSWSFSTQLCGCFRCIDPSFAQTQHSNPWSRRRFSPSVPRSHSFSQSHCVISPCRPCRRPGGGRSSSGTSQRRSA